MIPTYSTRFAYNNVDIFLAIYFVFINWFKNDSSQVRECLQLININLHFNSALNIRYHLLDRKPIITQAAIN